MPDSQFDFKNVLVKTILILSATIAFGTLSLIGGVIGGGVTVLIISLTGGSAVMSLVAAAIAGLLAAHCAHKLYQRVNKGPLPPVSKYITGSLSFGFAPLLALCGVWLLGCVFTVSALVQAIVIVALSGAIPFALLTLFDKFGLFQMPNTRS